MNFAKHFLRLFFLITILFLFFSGRQDSSFTLILIPDTQTCTEEYPEILSTQTEWIADHAKEFSFVLQQGDITDDNTEEQWKTAAKAFSKLDGEVPYTVALGNHDNGRNSDVRDTKLFNKFFPYKKFSKEPYFKEAFRSGVMDNTCHTFTAGGYDWLVFSLEFGPRTSVLNWAAKIIEEHPNHKVIINTHAYLYSDNRRMGEGRGHQWLPQQYGIGKVNDTDAVNNGEQMWDKLVSKYQNIMFVFCGHVLNSGTGLLVSQGKHGNRVYQMLANYQGGVEGSENGGNGFLRLVTINPLEHTISVKTYSPYLDQYKTEPNQEFTFTDVKF